MKRRSFIALVACAPAIGFNALNTQEMSKTISVMQWAENTIRKTAADVQPLFDADLWTFELFEVVSTTWCVPVRMLTGEIDSEYAARIKKEFDIG